MNEVTRILSQIDEGGPAVAEQLLPIVYEELRRLAAQKIAQEAPGQTLQATALVHEAYLRLVGAGEAYHWNGRGHFFAAAAEAMRRILVENARHKKSLKAGGAKKRVEFADADLAAEQASDDVLALDEALTKLSAEDPTAAELAKLRLFGGLTVAEAAGRLGMSRRTGYRHWTYARAFMQLHLQPDNHSPAN